MSAAAYSRPQLGASSSSLSQSLELTGGMGNHKKRIASQKKLASSARGASNSGKAKSRPHHSDQDSASSNTPTPPPPAEESPLIRDEAEKIEPEEKEVVPSQPNPETKEEEARKEEEQEEKGAGDKKEESKSAEKVEALAMVVVEKKEEMGPVAAAMKRKVGIPRELLSSHPLEHPWVLWYHKYASMRSWKDCLKQVGRMETVEEFFALYHNMRRLSSLAPVADLSLFKEGMEPTWEDEANRNGGKFWFQVQPGNADGYWIELQMAMIGGQFGDVGEEICGAVANIRKPGKGDKICLWTASGHNMDPATKARLMDLGRRLKIVLAFAPEHQTFPVTKIEFLDHVSASNRVSSILKPNFVI